MAQSFSATILAVGYQDNWGQILTSAFMRNALIGGTLVALAAGLIGYFIIVRNSAFAAHALAHIGFPGATGAVLLGIPVTAGLAVFCVGGALVIGRSWPPPLVWGSSSARWRPRAAAPSPTCCSAICWP